MLTKCRAISIRTIDYSESSIILKCYTSAYGMQSYLVNGVRKNKGQVRPSQLLPLTLLELDVYHQNNKNIQRIKELKCTPQLQQLHFDVVKSAIGMFTAEVIYRSIKEENEADHALFEFLYNSIQILDIEHDRLANFPVYFMLQLSRFLGFYPKQAVSRTHVGFNFKDGLFEPFDHRSPFMADEQTSTAMLQLLNSSYEEQKGLPIHSETRKKILNTLILYYNEHLSGFSNMKSHEILSEVLE
jgi:DNA repair protein RecO (recombination protein O)